MRLEHRQAVNRIKQRSILLSSGENVHIKPVAQRNHELVDVGKARKQNRCNVGVSQQEQKGVAGVVFAVVG